MVLLEGINDIGFGGITLMGVEPDVSAEQVIGAYAQLIARAHQRGTDIFGATMLPFRGSFYFSETKERIRSTVSTWIRSSGAFDGVIDFDAVVRDPKAMDALKPDFDSGDHLHPNDSGYDAMGNAVDVRLFDRMTGTHRLWTESREKLG